jgi:hypothetical protein
VNVALHNKKDFVGVIKLRALRCKIILDYLGDPGITTEVLLRRRWEIRRRRRCNIGGSLLKSLKERAQ